ncbi:unnamed protein product, partial [Prorocentrum cordatum]
ELGHFCFPASLTDVKSTMTAAKSRVGQYEAGGSLEIPQRTRAMAALGCLVGGFAGQSCLVWLMEAGCLQSIFTGGTFAF